MSEYALAPKANLDVPRNPLGRYRRNVSAGGVVNHQSAGTRFMAG